ncbi:MAG: hypothetical protein HY909_14890 [Deltaproteobacteria bacterium]|nr:hypothetical protein [Deltaproteobacteria bacterium]
MNARRPHAARSCATLPTLLVLAAAGIPLVGCATDAQAQPRPDAGVRHPPRPPTPQPPGGIRPVNPHPVPTPPVNPPVPPAGGVHPVHPNPPTPTPPRPPVVPPNVNNVRGGPMIVRPGPKG